MAMWPVQLLCDLSNQRRHVEDTELRSRSWRKTNTPSTTTRLRSCQQAPSPEPNKPRNSSKSHHSKKLKRSKKDKNHRRRTTRENEDSPLVTIQLAFRESSQSRKLKKRRKRSKSSEPYESLDLKKSKKHLLKSSHDHGSTPPKSAIPAPRQSSPQSPPPRELKKAKRRRREASGENKMGVVSSASRRSKTASPNAKEKRNKTPKPHSRCASATPNPAVATKKERDKAKKPKHLGPGTRPGAHQELPITIDSDDESSSAESMETTASAAIRAYGMPAPPVSPATPRSTGSINKVSLPHIPRHGTFLISSPAPRYERAQTARPFAPPLRPARAHDPTVCEERFVSVSVEPSTPNKARNKPSSLAEQPPRRAQTETASFRDGYIHNRHTSNMSDVRLQPYLVGAPPSPASPYADDGIELTLADITDFNLRQKTADLMVIAPGLPIADIYHLLMERRGRLEEAKQDVIRQSQRQFATPPTQRPVPQARAATVPITIPNDSEEKVEDDTYIKIDFDDPSFIYDNDAPVEPLAQASRQRRNSQARPKKSVKKATAKPKKSATNARQSSGLTSTEPRSPSCSVPHPRTPIKSHVKTPAYPTTPVRADKSRKGHAVKKTKGRGTGDINRGMRETSYDRSFIVSDEEILVDASDDTYSESDGADVDMTDDGTDLTIDMEPEYSYNSDILSSPMSR